MRKPFVLAALALLTVSCGKKSAPTDESTAEGSAAPPKPLHYSTKDLPHGLDMHLSDGKQGKPAVDHSKLAPAKSLPDGEVQALLSRAATTIKTDPSDTASFALRPSSQPPPRTGDTIHESFPPPASSNLPPAKAADQGKDLRVLRYMPETFGRGGSDRVIVE